MSEKVFAIDDETEAYRLIAHFSTYYGDSKQNRKDNIALAARKSTGWCYIPRTSSLSTTSWADALSKTDLKPHTSFKTVILSKAWAAEFVKCQALFTTARCLQTLQ